VTSAITIAVGLRRGLTPLIRGREGTFLGQILSQMVNVGAVGSTSALNMFLMRKGELSTGIEVTTEDGKSIGMSQIAAKSAITQTAICRVVYILPIFFGPPILKAFAKAVGVIGPATPRVFTLLFDVATISLGLYLSIPICCGIFPQYGRIRTD